jgi:hypothetical protein
MAYTHVTRPSPTFSPDTSQSLTVEAVTGTPTEKKSTGQNCFRFLVPVSDLQANPLTKPLLDRIGLRSLNAFADTTSPLRRLVIYPCRAGTLLNGVMFYPSNDSLDESSWLNSGSKEDLRAQVASYSPALRALCSMADDVKHWSLASRDPAPVFYKEKLVLVGDAAHPTLPRKTPSLPPHIRALTQHRPRPRRRASFRRRGRSRSAAHGRRQAGRHRAATAVVYGCAIQACCDGFVHVESGV